MYCHSDTDRKVDKKIRIASGDLSNEILHIIKLSGDEDLLIGGYDTGTIRVWSIQGYSLTTLKNLLEKFLSTQRTSKDHTDFARGGKRSKGVRRTGAGFGVGLAISPILLLYEWTAHYSPILSGYNTIYCVISLNLMVIFARNAVTLLLNYCSGLRLVQD